MGRAERGFTLLEALVAFGAFTVAGAFFFAAIAGIVRWSGALSERELSEAQTGALAERLESEQNSAWSIFTPFPDGRELHFFTRDARSRAHFWAYRFDPRAQTLQRFVYGAPGDSMTADGAPIAGVVSFFAQTLPLTALQDEASPLYSHLYDGAALSPATVDFGFAGRPFIAGGNQITYVRIATRYAVRELALSTQTAPSGFTIVLRYTPAPSPGPSAYLTAAIATSQVFGQWRDCPDPSKDCSNTDWPQYHWTQTITTRYYRSADGGYTWSQVDVVKTALAGISTPTGGDVPSQPCDVPSPADFTRACSPDWTPAAPQGTAGLDLTP